MTNCSLGISSGVSSSSKESSELMTILDFCMHVFNFLVGFPTHSYVLWLILTETGSGIASEFFVLNLSVCELAYGLNVLIRIFDIYVSSITWLKFFVMGFCNTGRPLFQSLICLERYLAVVHPLTFLKYKPLRYRVVCCALVWILILGSCLCFMYLLLSCNFYNYVVAFSFPFLLFVSMQLFCMVAVLRALKQFGPGDRKKEDDNRMKRRAFYLILITTVSTSIIYLPFTITGFYFLATQQYFKEPFTAGFLCFVLAGFVQPVLYLVRVRKLQCCKRCLVVRK